MRADKWIHNLSEGELKRREWVRAEMPEGNYLHMDENFVRRSKHYSIKIIQD
jgi:hypothetical protein